MACDFSALKRIWFLHQRTTSLRKPGLQFEIRYVFLYLLLQCGTWPKVIANTCPEGKFGDKCQLTCHCFNGDKVCDATGCSDSLCRQGFRNAPDCQTVCSPGRFGQSCLFLCHCPENDFCDPVNGYCRSGRCHRNWYGRGCQTQLSTLVNPPTAKVLDCHTVSVSWNAWNYDSDLGSTTVSFYSLKMRSKSDVNWVNIKDVLQNENNSKYTVNVTGLTENSLYQFRIDVISSSKKINISGPIGVPTPFIFVLCSALVDKTLQTINTTDDGHIEIFLHKKYQSTVKVSYEETGIGDCDDISANVSSITFDSSFVVLNTSLWRHYTITVEIMSPYNLHYVESVLTAEMVPTGKIKDVRIISLSANHVTIEWDNLPCAERGGVLIRYEIVIQSDDIAATRSTLKTKYQFLVIPDLKPFTKYGVRIRYVNSVGAGGFSEELIFQSLQTIPDAPLLSDIITKETEATVTWKRSKQPNGILTLYMVRCIQTTDPTQVIDIVHPASKDTAVTFYGLQPYTNYSVKIRASTDIGWGNFSDSMTAMTKESIPGPTLNLLAQYHNECIALSWDPPEKPNGVIISYKLITRELFSYTRINQEPLQSSLTLGNITSYRHCKLLPATLYGLEIAASTSIGTGKVGVTGSYWTEIKTPPAPLQPILTGFTDTLIEVILRPSTIFTGPISWYDIRVHRMNNIEKCTEIDVNDYKTVKQPPGILVAKLTPKYLDAPINFKVGDSKVYGGVVNSPLSNNSCYQIFYALYSSLNNVTKFNFSSTKGATKSIVPIPPVRLAAILIPIFILLIVAIVAILLFFLCRKYRWCKPSPEQIFTIKTDDYVVPENTNDLEKHWTSVRSLNERRHLVIHDGLPNGKYHSSLYRNGDIVNLEREESNKKSQFLSFREEYDALNNYYAETSPNISNFKEACKRENTCLNRFPQKLPYDRNRVILKPDTCSNNTYINASYIGDKTARQYKYIAAQSPFNKETVCDFWRLIYQHKVKVVVMLTKHVEENVLKCSKYFPQLTGEYFRLEIFNMKILTVQTYADYSITTINVSVGNEIVQEVCIFEFFSWPESITSRNAVPLLEMHRKISRVFTENMSPILVHCGTGINRTGTFIIIDILLEEYRQKRSINLFNIIKNIRKSMNFTLRPYAYFLFVYDAVFEMYQDRYDFNVTYENINPQYLEQFLQIQFDNLCRFIPKIDDDQFIAGRLQINKSKNRFLAILPPENFRPILRSAKSAYINAVFLDGCSRKNHYILTQTPMKETLGDFWQLIYEYNVRTIVMMDNNVKNDTCVSYWKMSTGGSTLWSTEHFDVEIGNRIVDYDSILEQFQLKVTKPGKESVRKIRLYRYQKWKGPNFVPVCRDYILYLIQHVAEWQSTNNHKPIVVHCKDGATNSGLFCVADVLIEKMKCDNFVDVYHTVKHMKRRRPEIIQDMVNILLVLILLNFFTSIQNSTFFTLYLEF
ncbi:receptor-type tyrosine-protein phosphatase delta [Octopus bimaculoides]|uniref:receptor-type tyrosine-protein phosphatase delta n=1 Tax=Octopus bimaculoides TaxID=37653 RepID=UPI00071D1B3F|nr:receptor-type tyrosine-protein phosphatase delta [Octopus bimaculoides]|eukprot:XP_014790249.1 PREDICTED: receptor-type tyrosine-protein phosphatase delta-like [Octopus bimaculoides]